MEWWLVPKIPGTPVLWLTFLGIQGGLLLSYFCISTNQSVHAHVSVPSAISVHQARAITSFNSWKKYKISSKNLWIGKPSSWSHSGPLEGYYDKSPNLMKPWKLHTQNHHTTVATQMVHLNHWPTNLWKRFFGAKNSRYAGFVADNSRDSGTVASTSPHVFLLPEILPAMPMSHHCRNIKHWPSFIDLQSLYTQYYWFLSNNTQN